MFESMVESVGGATVCRVRGDLDALAAPALRQGLAPLTCEPRLVLDLSGVAFIDSAGLGALVGIIRRVRECGGQIAVSTGRATVRRVLHVAGFDRIVGLSPTVEDAVASLAEAVVA